MFVLIRDATPISFLTTFWNAIYWRWAWEGHRS